MSESDMKRVAAALLGDEKTKTPSVFERLIRVERFCLFLLVVEVAFHGMDTLKILLK